MNKKELVGTIGRDVLERMSWAKARRTNLYIETTPLMKGDVIRAYRREIPIERESVFVFADDAPMYNWAHPCRYLLYSADSGVLYDEVKEQFPPYMNTDSRTFGLFHAPYVFERRRLSLQYRAAMTYAEYMKDKLGFFIEGKRYGILFSGASNNRHTNDLEFMYRTLIDVYGFEADNIYVMNYDGTINYSGHPEVENWPGDDTAYRMPVHRSGAKADFEAVFDDLSNRIRRNDFLFIHTNNHGGHDGTESYLCTYSGDDYLASDFAAKLADLPGFAQLMVMMEQCHSGGFVNPVIDNSPADETSIATACEELKNSAGGPEFDPFAMDWIAAVTGTDPYGSDLDYDPDTNGNNQVSAREAFDYAESVKVAFDTPVYDDSPTGCGDDMVLGQIEPNFVLAQIADYLEHYKDWRYGRKLVEEIPIGPRPVGPKDSFSIYQEVIKQLGILEKLIRK